jgi:hypothetical protein
MEAQNGSWQPYQAAPADTWYVGVSTPAGPSIIAGTIDHPAYFSVGGTWPTEPVFTVPAGYYAVLEYYAWASDGHILQQWATLQSNYAWASYHPTADGYCSIQ